MSTNLKSGMVVLITADEIARAIQPDSTVVEIAPGRGEWKNAAAIRRK